MTSGKKLNCYSSNLIRKSPIGEKDTNPYIIAATKGEAMRIAQTIPGGFVYGRSIRKACYRECYYQKQIEILKDLEKRGLIRIIPRNEMEEDEWPQK
jgi:hypothetical protein